MDSFTQRLHEEIEFWQTQIEIAEKRDDQDVLPRLWDALKLVEFKLERYQCRTSYRLGIREGHCTQ